MGLSHFAVRSMCRAAGRMAATVVVAGMWCSSPIAWLRVLAPIATSGCGLRLSASRAGRVSVEEPPVTLYGYAFRWAAWSGI